MSFQFLCPNGHLLEGDPAHQGQQCACPTCGITFAIPTVPAEGGNVEAAQEPQAFTPQINIGGADPGGADSGGADFPDVTGTGGTAANPFAEPAERILHIPCPNGHELETPQDMLGQEVLCPHCGAQFPLRYQDSVEAKREREAELERRDRKLGNLWLNWAVIAAIVVVVGIFVLIFLSREPK